MPLTTNAHPSRIDGSKLQDLARARLGRTVDWDMRGSPVTDVCVLMGGALGPAVLRLVSLALQLESSPLTKERLAELAPEAFAQAEDLNYSGVVITDYSILLAEPHGYGRLVHELVNLAMAERAAVSLT